MAQRPMIRVIKSFFASAFFVAALVFGLSVLETGRAEGGEPDEQARWTKSVAQTKAYVDGAQTLMKTNGLYAAIQGAGGHSKELMAMAIHESDGRLGTINKGGPAYCAFQIYHTNVPSFAARNGLSPESYIQKLLSDPAFCTQEGAYVLNDHIGRLGYEKGICSYGGQLKAYNANGSCAMLREIKIIMGLIDGTLQYEVVTDEKSPDYGNVIVKDGGGEIVTQLNCQDRSRSLIKALAEAREAYISGAQADLDEMIEWSHERDRSNPKRNFRQDIIKTYCLHMYFDAYSAIRALMLGAAWVEAFILSVVDQVLAAICAYITPFVLIAIDVALTAWCLPMPSLSIGLDLPSLDRKSCDGLSLGSLMAVQQGHVSLKDAASWTGGLPPINGWPTPRADVPPLLQDFRRLIRDHERSSGP